MRRPLHCPHCGEPFAGRPPLVSELFRVDHRTRKVLMANEELIASAIKESTYQVSGSAGDFLSNASILRILWKKGVPNPPACCTLPSMYCLDAYPVLSTTTWRGIESDLRWEEQHARESAAVIKAVGRHLAKLVRRYCGHRRPGTECLASTEGSGTYVQAAADRCIACWALCTWRCQFASLMGPLRRPFQFGAMFRREGNGMLPIHAAAIAWTSFGWCLAEARARDLAYAKWRLPVWRFHGPEWRAVVRVTKRGHEAFCGLSPQQALNALPKRYRSPQLTTRRGWEPGFWGQAVLDARYRQRDYV
jgi:hypothetical protein